MVTNPIERARTMQRLARLVGMDNDKVATSLGVSVETVRRYRSLLKLDTEVVWAVEVGLLSETQALRLRSRPEAEQRELMAYRLWIRGGYVRDRFEYMRIRNLMRDSGQSRFTHLLELLDFILDWPPERTPS